ncbi:MULTISPECIES: DUF1206 domain-containing protein [Bifidobacterium]|nr:MULTISPECIES: DUF1206 domain-containing protein [Bifidobacterium]
MMLRIDSARLDAMLQRRSPFIGFGAKATNMVAAIEGAFLVLTVFTTAMPMGWRIAYGVLGGLAFFYAVAAEIMAWVKGYDADTLYRELVDMDRTAKRSSIIAVRDGARYLLYHDAGWDCDFFPNHATAEGDEENLRRLEDYFSSGFDIPQSDFTLTRIGGEAHEKYSTEHDERRWYEYTLYRADVKHMPDAWRADSFHVDSKDCRWMSVDEMMADPRIREVNADVVGMVKNRL